MIVIIIGRIFICIISMLILFMYLDFLLNSSIFAWSFDLKAAILAFCQVFVSFIILLSFTESTSFFLTPALNRFSIIEKPITAKLMVAFLLLADQHFQVDPLLVIPKDLLVRIQDPRNSG